MLYLKSIKLNNFLSHQDTEIEFKEDQKMLLDGISGVGKSAIIDAIIWAFYNRSRNDNRSLIRRGAKKAIVILDIFNKNEEDGLIDGTYQLKRSIDDKGKHSFEVLEFIDKEYKPILATGLRGVQEYLEDKILKSSYLLFINSIAYPQDNAENFIKQTAIKRKDIILDIIKANSYEDHYDMVKAKLTDMKMDESLMVAEIAGIKVGIEDDEPLAKDLERMATDVKGCKEIIKDYKDRIEKAEKIEMKNVQIKADINSKREQIKLLSIDPEKFRQKQWELETEINSFNRTDIESLVKAVAEYNEIVKELEVMEETRNRYDEWKRKRSELIPIQHPDYTNEINSLNKKISELLTSAVDKCPEINKECPILIKKKDEEINELSLKLKQYKEADSDHKEYLKILERDINNLGAEPNFDIVIYQSKKNRLKELEIKRTEYDRFNNMQVIIDKKKEELCLIEGDKVRNASAISSLENDIKVLEGKLDPIIEEEKKNMLIHKTIQEEKLEDLTSSLALCKEADKRLTIAKKKLVDLETKLSLWITDIDNLSLLKDAFSNTGIKTIIIDLVLPQLEDKINEVLSRLSNFRVRLDTQKEAIGDEKIIEGLFITVINDMGNELALENYSGGEKVKITTAIAEGLASLQNFGFRLFDENIIGLDADTIEGFVGVLASIKDRFKQLVCISHLQQIKDIFEERIDIIKVNGISKIK